MHINLGVRNILSNLIYVNSIIVSWKDTDKTPIMGPYVIICVFLMLENKMT